MIEYALVISLIILFLHATTWEGHIFEGVRKLINEESKISKPIYNCPICMTPWWGSAIYWIFFHVSFQHWILTIGAAAGFAVIWVLMIAIKDFATTAKKEIKDELP